jgi:hypothetical protein
MAFRKSIPQSELREKLPKEDRENGNTYQSSRGGWFPKSDDQKSGSKGDKR